MQGWASNMSFGDRLLYFGGAAALGAVGGGVFGAAAALTPIAPEIPLAVGASGVVTSGISLAANAIDLLRGADGHQACSVLGTVVSAIGLLGSAKMMFNAWRTANPVSIDTSPESAPLARDPKDVNLSPVPPRANNGVGYIGNAENPNQRILIQADLADVIESGATDIRMGQWQVNARGMLVGRNQPDLQFTRADGRRVYVEYEWMNNPRGDQHAIRILANDPDGMVIVRLVPEDANQSPVDIIYDIDHLPPH